MTDRRPIASRNAKPVQRVARWLAGTAITPNRISQASMVFAALAFAAFWASAAAGPWCGAALLVLAAVGCQLRLACNLFDGLVAVEAEKSAADGAFWNEVPDRAADLLILAGAGLAVGQLALGLSAGALALLTAYVREFGRAEGLAQDFAGPMAKPHRMAAVTIGALAGAVEGITAGSTYVLWGVLWIVVLGTAFTALRRARRIVDRLNARGKSDQGRSEN